MKAAEIKKELKAEGRKVDWFKAKLQEATGMSDSTFWRRWDKGNGEFEETEIKEINKILK